MNSNKFLCRYQLLLTKLKSKLLRYWFLPNWSKCKKCGKISTTKIKVLIKLTYLNKYFEINKCLTNCKWAANGFRQEKRTIVKLQHNISKSSEAGVTFALLIHHSRNSIKFSEKYVRSDSRSLTKTHHTVSCWQFSENC